MNRATGMNQARRMNWEIRMTLMIELTLARAGGSRPAVRDGGSYV
jgi:hypothetical protein